MKCPCKRECPDWTPGCSCEKREAWLSYREGIKKEKRRDDVLTGYQRDAVRKNRKTSIRRRHRI